MCGFDERIARRTAAHPVDFDHVAIGLAEVEPTLNRLVDTMGATVVYGGSAVGCRYVCTKLGDDERGMMLELLEPTDDDPFLSRFLERRGPGPHHITFIVDDMEGTLERFEGVGWTPAVARLDDPLWREVFFSSPKVTGGLVLQIGSTEGGLRAHDGYLRARADEHLGAATTARRGWYPDEQGWWDWPGPRPERSVYLDRVSIRSADLDAAEAIFRDVLGGHVAEQAPGLLELTWEGGGCLRFTRADDIGVALDVSVPALELPGTNVHWARCGTSA